MIVAFYAYAPESGKDAAGDAAAEWARMEHRTYAKRGFADPLKVVCADALGYRDLTDAQKVTLMDEVKFKGQITTDTESSFRVVGGRDFIIGLAGDSSGEFGIRRFDMGFWTRLALTYETECLFITDLRFQVEADAVREANGVIVEIRRPGTTHKNEDRIVADHVIQNDGDIQDLGLAVALTLDQIFPA